MAKKKKVPKNRSLAFSLLGAGSVAAVGYQLFRFMGWQGVNIDLSSMAGYAGAATLATAGTYAAHDYISSLPWRRFKVVCENTELYVAREAGLRLPRLRKKERQSWGWRLWYKLPIGMAMAQFDDKGDRFEAALDAEVSFAFRRGLLRVDVLPGEIPTEAAYKHHDLAGEIPFTVGVGREGLITADLASFPHLLVAGQTGAGKSNFLHQMIASIRHNAPDAVLYIIDLKRVEFSYLKKTVNVKYNLPGALDTLEILTMEMERRMAFLDQAGFVGAKEWRAAHPDDANDELPYHVLIVDEFSQLCPVLAKEKVEREAKTYAHKLLVDLICLARSLGIHVVIATQRPDKDILPGQLKANIPATICFKVRNETNSRICLDTGRAATLPAPSELPGRAVWQHDMEREVQTLYLPMAVARGMLAASLSPSPAPLPPASFHLRDTLN